MKGSKMVQTVQAPIPELIFEILCVKPECSSHEIQGTENQNLVVGETAHSKSMERKYLVEKERLLSS